VTPFPENNMKSLATNVLADAERGAVRHTELATLLLCGPRYPHGQNPLVQSAMRALLAAGVVDTYPHAYSAALNLGEFLDQFENEGRGE